MKECTESEEGPPVPLGRGGGPHACSGASCCVGEPFWAHKNAKNLLVAGTPLGELTALPQTPWLVGRGSARGLCCPLPKNPTYNTGIVIVLVLCVYVHTCMKMHCYFLLNVKRGAS